MKQYLDLLQTIADKGVEKHAARENMPGTTSLFGYQFRHDLSEGFPLLTTKKLSFKNIVVELLWFLKGDTNIKYLVDNGCNIWNEDSYNYYMKKCAETNQNPVSFEDFVEIIRRESKDGLKYVSQQHFDNGYILGDCGMQYGKLWRDWTGTKSPAILSVNTSKISQEELEQFRKDWIEAMKSNKNPLIIASEEADIQYVSKNIDQIKELIEGLRKNPESRRHILTAWNPATLNDMALNACHALVQFNCRPIPWEKKLEMAKRHPNVDMENLAITEAAAGNPDYGPIPQYYIDCQMYQRSADAFLGVPYNIASYALLTEILAKICNMLPGDFIHTFGDVHVYENHSVQVATQLQRKPDKLPTLLFKDEFHYLTDKSLVGELSVDEIIEKLEIDFFKIENYNPQESIKGKLSTGLK